MNYSNDAVEFYNDCKEDGGPITLTFPNIKVGDDSGNAKPWDGSPLEPLTKETFAIFDILSSSVADKRRFGQTCYFSSYTLTHDGEQLLIDASLRITDQSGREYEVVAAPAVHISGGIPILYICEVREWPQK
ncbi:MAG TPA: hypothetical protein PK745_00050 [bacterium]|nr:hypothetical protein [bacterium]